MPLICISLSTPGGVTPWIYPEEQEIRFADDFRLPTKKSLQGSGVAAEVNKAVADRDGTPPSPSRKTDLADENTESNKII